MSSSCDPLAGSGWVGGMSCVTVVRLWETEWTATTKSQSATNEIHFLTMTMCKDVNKVSCYTDFSKHIIIRADEPKRSCIVVFHSLSGEKKQGLYLGQWSMFCMSLLCGLCFLPWLPTYVTMCLDGFGFYAIVRMWYVCIDCFACLPRAISANRKEMEMFAYMYIYAVKQKAWQIPTWCFTAVTTTTSENIGFSGLLTCALSRDLFQADCEKKELWM